MIQAKRKIEFAAQVANGSCGMPAIIFGILLCVFALISYLTELDTQTRNGYGRDLTYFAGFLVIVGVYSFFGYPRIRDYYRRKYGRTTEKYTDFRWFREGILVFIPFVLTYLFATRIDANHRLPFSVTIVCCALYAGFFWWMNYRGISNMMPVLSVVLLFAAFLPWEHIFLSVTNAQDYGARWVFYENLLLLIYGLISIVGGLTEYIFMVKTLTPIKREEEIYESV